MRMFSRVLSLCLFFLLITGCAPKYNINNIESIHVESPKKNNQTSKVYNKSYNTVWNALTNALFDGNYITISASKEGGIISTDMKEINKPTRMWLLEDRVKLWRHDDIKPTSGNNSEYSGQATILKSTPYSFTKFNSVISGTEDRFYWYENIAQTQDIYWCNGNRIDSNYNGRSYSFSQNYSGIFFKDPDELYFTVNKSRHQLQIRVKSLAKNKTRVDISVKNAQAFYYKSAYYDWNNQFYRYDFEQKGNVPIIDNRVSPLGSGWLTGAAYHEKEIQNIIFSLIEKNI